MGTKEGEEVDMEHKGREMGMKGGGEVGTKRGGHEGDGEEVVMKGVGRRGA